MGNIGSWIKRHPIWSGLFALVAALIIWSIFKPNVPEYEYLTATVERGDVVRKVSASGKLRALNTIKVGAEVSGQVTKVLVDFNSPVTAGQVLAVIDTTRVQARVQQAQAQVALAQAGMSQANANAARARADLQIQEREYGRREALAQKGFLSKAALDTALTQLLAARAGTQTTAALIQSSRAQIQQATAELSSARLDLSRTTIIAPTSGIVINKLVEPGTTVAASFQTPNLFEIAADITKMQVEASVDEADIGQVRDGQDVSFTVDSYPDEVFKAKVRQVRQSPVETQNVVSYLVILDVDNLDGKLLPGMTANVEIITSVKTNVTRVPTSALRFRPRTADLPAPDKKQNDTGKKDDKNNDKPGPTLYLASSDPYKPTKRAITTGIEGDDFTEILTGVKPGDKILLRSKSLKPKADADDSADQDDDAAAT